MRKLLLKFLFVTIVVLVTLPLSTPDVLASVIPVGIGVFGPGSTLTTFAGLASSTEVNGLTVNGIQFSYSLGNNRVVISGGAGVTNNLNPPDAESVGNNSGILSLIFPSDLGAFGYGYAVLSTIDVTNATTISLFQGATPVGTLSYNGTLDPFFAGGFAGIQSTTPFNRAQLTFNSVSAPAFALDNIRTLAATTAVPEPSSLLLMGTAFISLLFYRHRRSRFQ